MPAAILLLDRRAIERILLSFLAVVVVGVVSYALIGQSTAAVAFTVCFVVCLGSLALNRLGYQQLAGGLALTAVLAVLTYLMAVGRGLHDIALVGFPAAVVMAGLLLTGRWLGTVTALAILCVGGVTYGEMSGILRNEFSVETSWQDFGTIAAVLSIVAGYVWLLVSNIRLNAEAARQSERALKANEERFRALIEGIAEVILVLDRAGRIQYASPAFKEVMGLEVEEWVGSDILDLVHPQDLAGVKRMLGECLEEPGQRRVVELRMRHGRGRWLWTEVSGQSLLHLPSVGGIVLNFRDVTERREMMEAVGERAERRRLAIRSARMGVWEWNVDSDSVTWEPELFEMFGVTPERFGGTREGILQILHPEDRDSFAADLRRTLGEGVPFENELRYVRPDGEVRWIETVGQPHRDGEEGTRRIVGMCEDVTERRQAEDALRESEEKFAKTFNANPHPMSISSLESARILDVNESFLQTFGYRRDELIGRSAFEVGTWEKIEDRERLVSLLRREGSVHNEEFAFRTKSGEVRLFLLSVETIELRGEPCLLISSTDITEHQRLREQLLRAQRMEAMGRLVGGIAHDFNNWLTPIIGYSELVVDKTDAEDPRRHELEEIRKAGHRAAELAAQLLRFSRKELVEPRVLDLSEVVGSLDSMLRRVIGEDVLLTTKLDAAEACVRLDRSQLEQVIMNLVINARDAMPEGGDLLIETANVDPRTGSLPPGLQAAPDGYVTVKVSDTGCGIDARTLDKVFDPFFTTKETGKGTGLGLSTTYGIIKQAGGDIAVSSEVGKGTTFEVYLPRVLREQTVAGEEEVAEAEMVGGTILLVEDQRAVREFAATALRQLGHEVLTASNGHEALQVVRDFAGEIQLLITDLVMPAMNGSELASRLKAERPGIKVVFISGYAGNTLSGPAAPEPGGPLLHKPFTADALSRVVGKVLGAGSTSVGTVAVDPGRD